MQVDCIYNQEEAVDVTGAPAADLLSDMKKRYLTIPAPSSAKFQKPSAHANAVVRYEHLLLWKLEHVASAGVWRICKAHAKLVSTTSIDFTVCKR